MDTPKATTDDLLPNCIPEDWKAAKIIDRGLEHGGSELFWMVGKEGDKYLLMPRPLATVEIPAIAKELVHRCNAHQDLVDLLNQWVEHTKWREDFLIEDAEEGNENVYTRTRTFLQTLTA